MSNLYILDTSSLIELQETYPQSSFPTVWSNFESLVTSNQLISPIEVYNEIMPSNTFLDSWRNTNQNIFIQNTSTILSHVSEIMNQFPKLVDPNKTGPVADPFIIALARSSTSNITNSTPVILTQEKNRGVRIPTVATQYGINCVSLLELFNTENWTF